MADSSESESVDVAINDNRLGTCDVCGEFPAKYTCPRCEVKSCCLKCVKRHKTELNCSGERNKTAFKRISEFTNLDLLSDYRMLEETTRCVENYKRDPLKNFTRWNRLLPFHLSRLSEAVRSRGSKLLFFPPHFTRHKRNTTYLDWKTQKISWRIEWVFPQADFIKVVDERALENLHVSILLNKYLDPKSCPKELHDNLQFYQSAGLPEICVLLKAENVKKSSSKYYDVDPSMTLKAALKNKTIIEFPVIYVVLKDHKEMFEIICSDVEEEEEIQGVNNNDTRSGQHFSQWRHPNPRWKHNNPQFRHDNSYFSHMSVETKLKRKKQKNLLFNDDSSEGSLSDDCSSSKQTSDVVANSKPDFNIPAYHELIRQN